MANNRLYVGNLPYSVTSEQLQSMFAEYGEITSAYVIIDKRFNRSKGFGFVEFAAEDAATAAIEAMNGKEIDGRALVVNVARPMEPRPGFQNRPRQ
ncbi:RNA-binding protein [Candidatus Beckwithbacteria bacterium]|nr:RNA-binding protein [Candidatus Beckwithbacteria bacterium]